MYDLLAIAAGISLLITGGAVLVRHASILAHRAGVPTLVVGLTVVAFGTSAPELAVNTMAAIRGSGGINFGEIVGSNIANIALILGISASVTTLNIESRVLRLEMPRMLFVTGVFTALALGGTLGRPDGAVLLALFAAYVVIMYREAMGDMHRHQAITAASRHAPSDHKTLHSLGLIALGLGALWAGGEVTVHFAMGLARTLGVPEDVIALSFIAVGTSLPELVVSIMAILKGDTSLAIGNIVGSNIFNLLLVAGVCSTIAPFSVPAFGGIDLAVMCGLSVALIVMAYTHRHRIVRIEGICLLLLYCAYIITRYSLQH